MIEKTKVPPTEEGGERVIPVLVSVIALFVLVAVLILVPRLMLKRAVRKVIARFRREEATSPEHAKTLAELGLGQSSPFSMLETRAYRPYAIRLLGQAQILLGTEDGAVFLSEKNLEQSPVKKYAGVS